MDRQIIASSDIGSSTLSYTGVTFTAGPTTFFGKIMTNVKSYKKGENATADETITHDTVLYIIWNFFNFYSDCDCHFMFDKDEITSHMIKRDIHEIMTTVTNYMIANNIGPFKTIKSFDPSDKIERDIDRTENGMGEISPINADIDSLVNPSSKTKNVGNVSEETTNTTMWNKMQVLRYLLGDYSFKAIVEKRLKKYIYELNKIY